MDITPQNITIIQERPKDRDSGVITVRGGRLCVQELIAVLQQCPDPYAFVIIRDSKGIKLNCDLRMLDSVTPRRDCTVLLNFNKDDGWD